MRGRRKVPKAEDLERSREYDFTTQEGREATAEWLHRQAKNARTVRESEWVRYNDYYNGIHGVSDEVRDTIRERGIPWDAAVVPDPFIMVESQVDPQVPEPEFRGRDDQSDGEKAKQREYAVRYICHQNRLEDQNTANERRLRKLGDAFWKVYWDTEMDCGPQEGNIRVRAVPVESIYPDPATTTLQEGQYVSYVYRLHKLAFWRIYGQECTSRGITLEDVVGGEYQEGGDLFDMVSYAGARDDTVEVRELWFKQPFDTKDVPAGAVACTIQAGGKEVKYIPNYWLRTGRQNQLFPFVHYWCIRDENSFWNKSELEPIIPMVDAADRALANGLLNDAFTANDIILVEDGALMDGEEFTNVPGAQVNVKQNGIGKVARLGGLNDGRNSLPMVEWCLGQIQRANRNYETNLGKESARVQTASGLAQLRSDADSQARIKKADRNSGFARLYELIDWHVLEFFDDDRMIFIGAQKEGEENISFTFNADNYSVLVPPVADTLDGEMVRPEFTYWPRVDVTVSVGDGIIRSKQATLEVLDKLAAIPVTPENYKILSAQVEILDIPQRQEIIEMWEQRFASNVPQEVVDALGQDQQLLQAVVQAISMGGQNQEAGAPPTMPGGMPL